MDNVRIINEYLGLPPGSIHNVIINKKKDKNVIATLSKHGIILDEKLRIATRKEWHELCKKAGIKRNRTGFDDDEPVHIEKII